MTTKRQEARTLSEELLDDIELSRLDPVSIVRKASRFARLMDDGEALSWLSHEITGYVGTGGGLSPAEWMSTGRSGRRHFTTEEGKKVERANPSSLSSLQATVETAKTLLSNSESKTSYERSAVQSSAIKAQSTIDTVIGSVHQYVSHLYQELRFGSAVESAFENVRGRVDSSITSLVPSALPMLSTALENAQTDDPEQWRNGAKACRDLIKAAADTLRPSGPDAGKIKMGDGNYINRLVDWIESRSKSNTKSTMIKTDLSYLGDRLDAASDGGNKGSHAEISKEDTSRFIVGTYILLGDILELNQS